MKPELDVWVDCPVHRRGKIFVAREKCPRPKSFVKHRNLVDTSHGTRRTDVYIAKLTAARRFHMWVLQREPWANRKAHADRKQKAEGREQRAASSEQKAESRKQGGLMLVYLVPKAPGLDLVACAITDDDELDRNLPNAFAFAQSTN